jgi:putative Ca2+/H+ antiporter (TMEM165/GDT1 family)
MIRDFVDYLIMGAVVACCMVLVICTINFLYQRIPEMCLLVITAILLAATGFVLNMATSWWLNR